MASISTISNIEWPDYLVIALHFALTVAVGLWVSNALDPAMGKVTNVRPAFFYTKPFVYNSVAICLIIIKLSHHPV